MHMWLYCCNTPQWWHAGLLTGNWLSTAYVVKSILAVNRGSFFLMWTYYALAYLSYHEKFGISYCQLFIHDDRQSLNYLLEECCFRLIHLIIVDKFSLKILSFFYPVSCCHQYPHICLNLLVMPVWILMFVTLICHSPFICLMLWYKGFFALMPFQYFVEAGAIAVRRVRKEDLRHVAKATGATVVRPQLS